MEPKSFASRGVQQDDVWSAADSLIAEGLKPTIERVRQKIGRGSPNTVSPMLEAWFATLGMRLGVIKNMDDTGTIPKILQQALKDVWEIALSASREESASEIVQVQTVLMQETQALSKREAEIDQVEQVRAVKRQALEEALVVARNSTEEALARLSAAQAQAGRNETEIQHLHVKLASVEIDRDLERRRNQEATAQYIFEQQKAEERAQIMQHKMLEEIDRARQESKKLASEAQAAKKQFFTEKVFLEERKISCEKDLTKIQALCEMKSLDLDALRQASAISDLRALELQGMLKAQLADSTSAVARLTKALLNQTERQAKGPGKVGRTLRTRRG